MLQTPFDVACARLWGRSEAEVTAAVDALACPIGDALEAGCEEYDQHAICLSLPLVRQWIAAEPPVTLRE